MQIVTEQKTITQSGIQTDVKMLAAVTGPFSLLKSGCEDTGCSPICSKCSLHHGELCCMADEFPESVEESCLLPKFICGYINRVKPAKLDKDTKTIMDE